MNRDTRYNAVKARHVPSLAAFRPAYLRALGAHDLLASGTFAIDGTGLRHSDAHVVILQHVGDTVIA